MESGGAVIAGVVCGLAGSVAPVLLLEMALRGHSRPTVAMGLLSIFASYLMLMAALLVVWLVAPHQELTFGVALVAAFLVLWWVEAIRAWRAALRR